MHKLIGNALSKPSAIITKHALYNSVQVNISELTSNCRFHTIKKYAFKKENRFEHFRKVQTNVSKLKELQIPISYGNIAAKAWGSETAFPVLAFHGWLDNCGTFDRLIPLLCDQFYYVAIDAPGHGLSSHKPPGCIYTEMDFVVDFKKAADFFGWQKFHILGHSMGGAMASMFSCVFPDSVAKLMLLDVVKPMSLNSDCVLNMAKRGIAEYLRMERKLSESPPVYTPEAAVQRLMKGMHNEITENSARVLVKRGTQPSSCGKGVLFSRDLRCRTVEQISIKSHELIENIVANLRCELLIILANDTNINYQPDSPEMIELFCDIYRKNIKKFVLERVDGNHFVHLNNPEVVAPIINKFLLG